MVKETNSGAGQLSRGVMAQSSHETSRLKVLMKRKFTPPLFLPFGMTGEVYLASADGELSSTPAATEMTTADDYYCGASASRSSICFINSESWSVGF
jgi:hypothetical protein